MQPVEKSDRRFGAFVLTYMRPGIVRQAIQCILDQTRPPDLVAVIDNGNSEETRQAVESFPSDRVAYVPTGRNLGSAGGTAFGFRWLYEQDYDFIYCGDDDDPPRTGDTLERVLRIAASASAPVGAGAVGARWDWNKGELVRLADEALSGTIEVDMVGGGQQLILARQIIQSVGVPEGSLFFGYPDLEYSLRIRRAGYSLLVDGDLMREYRRMFGKLELQGRRSIVPRRSYASVWRNYYTTRNYIYMMRVTFGRPDLARRELTKILARSLAAWSRGPKYGGRFMRYQLMGIVDGYRGRMGCTVMPQAKYVPERAEAAMAGESE